MAGKKHAALSPESQFCAVTGCGHPSYRKVCKPEWSHLKYPETHVSTKTGKAYTVRKSYQAHHLLCLAEMGAVVVGEAAERELLGIVNETKWCINKKKNMLAMPVWGHTIMWYCNDFVDVAKSEAMQSWKTGKSSASHFKIYRL